MPEPKLDPGDPAALAGAYARTRALSEALAEPLSDADATIQSMEDASPAKWHLAHTTWFWETFLLRDNAAGYTLFDEDFPYLFNSYYEAEGERHSRGSRGMLSRPTLDRVLEWRQSVDEAMQPLLEEGAHGDLIRLGIAHEQQHQELLLTDIKHALFQNPTGPAMWEPSRQTGAPPLDHDTWLSHPGGIALIGHDAASAGPGAFAFDCEGPRHRVLLEPFAMRSTLVTNGEWDAFVADGGYRDPSLWLSDGWAWVRENGIEAPLYWRGDEHFTHTGWRLRDAHAPVTHISHFEADAFASWAGARLPTEFEWEAFVRSGQGGGFDADGGNQLESAHPPAPRGGTAMFGDCWQFTRSAYLPYPGFRPAEGAVGEYNGKFMSGQVVLRGASCATVRGHSRPSYRNFFYPHQRWQFTGLRLAKDD